MIGIDVGSVSVKLAALFKNGEDNSLLLNLVKTGQFFIPDIKSFHSFNSSSFLLSRYSRHYGNPLDVTAKFLESFFKFVPEKRIAGIWAVGSGGKLISQQWGFHYLNEYRAVAEAVGFLYPDVFTIFELGGERSKYILLSREKDGKVQISDYETNGECAAGTGSFFDQQVERLRYKIEDVGKIIAGVKRTASIAGRCSVFAKSDMIHAQQRGYKPAEVLKGLCEAVVRNFKGTIAKGKTIKPKVAFIGGVAANEGVVKAFQELFGFYNGELVISDFYAWMGALGGMLVGLKKNPEKAEFFWHPLKKENKKDYPTTHPLSLEKVKFLGHKVRPYKFTSDEVIDAFLGIDIGSVSTNLALIDSGGELIYGIYKMTEGRPVEIVEESLKEMESAVGHRVNVRGAGTTGSGRELIGLLIGADVIKDEITAHRTGAFHVSQKYLGSNVDTIFEIGGQDSKFISLKDGVVTDFSLNEACAAGTGSFLEEQAKQIGIEIRGEFAELALKSKHPLKLGERCTVFMEKELVPYLQQGVPKEDIVAGLAISVVHNYLNRVVKKRRIGERIFFQGGTAYNGSVAAAFATILDKEIIVPPYNGIMGAIGAALLARNWYTENKDSSFRGWDLSQVQWQMKEFICNGCSNHCIIQEFKVGGEKSYWGDKCSDKYRKRTKSINKPCIDDLIHFRENLLFASDEKKKSKSKRGVIGIPRALFFYDRFPFWRSYFETLGFDVMISRPTQQSLVHDGLEATVADPCFPVQAAHGHLVELMRKKPKYILLPNIVNEEAPSSSIEAFICPWSQTVPLVVKQTPAFREIKNQILSPNVHFREGKEFVKRRLRKEFSFLGITAKENHFAVENAYKTQAEFRNKMIEVGRRALEEIKASGESSIVLLGRPYNLYDPGLNLNIPTKLRDIYGVNVIPMDFLPIDEVDITSVNDHMFWNYGRRILQAAKFTKKYEKFHIIYISNFKCGPDSYIRHYVEEASGKPFLFLQLDSHANDAGVMTRIEAFLESKGML